jgi:hypothetical protein
MFGLVLATVAARAAERVSAGGAQWPNVALDESQWPNLRLDDIEAPRVNKRPSFVDPQEVEDRIMGRKPRAAAKSSAAPKPNIVPDREPTANGLDANASAGIARWPTLRPERPVSPFAFEVGGRYWYSSGRLAFAFANGNPLFGNPTSTLDWRGLSAHSGEVFARIDRIPSGVFVKGLVGLGAVTGGHIDDLDFLVTQFKFSDTTSDVHNGNLSYGMLDVGWAYSPMVGVRLGFFAGYHYWHEKVTAYGIVCNMRRSRLSRCGRGDRRLRRRGAELRAHRPCGASVWKADRVSTAGRSAARSPAFPMRPCATRTAICCGRAWRTSDLRRTSSPRADTPTASRARCSSTMR